MKNKGFTLAEVLITLTVIGIITAITIPSLLTSTQDREYKVAAQKALATLSNAMTMRIATSGEDFEDYREWVKTKPGVKITQGDAQVLSFFTCSPGSVTSNDAEPELDADGNPVLTGIVRIGCNREKAALRVIDCPLGDTCRLKDGMTVRFHSSGDLIIVFDTNGIKGPARQIGAGINAPNCSNAGRTLDGKSVFSRLEETPDTNNCPDLVAFWLNPANGEIEPADKRTRNILSSGNAMVEK